MQTNIRFVASNVPQIEPVVGKILDEPIEASIIDKPIGLSAKCVGIAELSRGSQIQQWRVRPRVRQEMRQPRGDSVLIEIASRWIRRFAQIEEVAGTEKRLVTGKHRFGKRASLLEPSLNEQLESNQSFRRNRLARGEIHEPSQQTLCVFGGIFGSDIGAYLVEQHLVGRRRPRLGRKWTFDFQPLKGNTWLAAFRKWWIAIGRRATIDVPCQRNG